MIITFIAGFALGLMVALILNETLDKYIEYQQKKRGKGDGK